MANGRFSPHFGLLHQIYARGGAQSGGNGGENGRQQVNNFLDKFFFGHGSLSFEL